MKHAQTTAYGCMHMCDGNAWALIALNSIADIRIHNSHVYVNAKAQARNAKVIFTTWI